MIELRKYIEQAVAGGANEFYIAAGSPVTTKAESGLVPLSGDRLLPPQTEALVGQLYTLAGREMGLFHQHRQDSFSFSVPGLARFWASVYQQRKSLAAAIRVLPFSIPDWRELGVPEKVMELAGLGRGLVLLSGPKGSGKAATLACLADAVNQSRACHMVTVEDPIQYLHKNVRSMVSQLELGTDTESYAAAMENCLSQTAEVILLGNIPDLETLSLCVTAAESGRLIIAALPVKGAARAVSYLVRLTEPLPPAQREQTLFQLSRLLSGSVSQQLLPLESGGAAAAFELMGIDSAVREAVREGDAHRLGRFGFESRDAAAMDQAISRLYQDGRITLETALRYADNPEQLRRRLG